MTDFDAATVLPVVAGRYGIEGEWYDPASGVFVRRALPDWMNCGNWAYFMPHADRMQGMAQCLAIEIRERDVLDIHWRNGNWYGNPKAGLRIQGSMLSKHPDRQIAVCLAVARLEGMHDE